MKLSFKKIKLFGVSCSAELQNRFAETRKGSPATRPAKGDCPARAHTACTQSLEKHHGTRPCPQGCWTPAASSLSTPPHSLALSLLLQWQRLEPGHPCSWQATPYLAHQMPSFQRLGNEGSDCSKGPRRQKQTACLRQAQKQASIWVESINEWYHGDGGKSSNLAWLGLTYQGFPWTQSLWIRVKRKYIILYTKNG